MSFDWQTVLAFLCVALAALYFGREVSRSWRSIGKGESGCGSCSGCSGGSTKNPVRHEPGKRVGNLEIIPLTEGRPVRPDKR